MYKVEEFTGSPRELQRHLNKCLVMGVKLAQIAHNYFQDRYTLVFWDDNYYEDINVPLTTGYTKEENL